MLLMQRTSGQLNGGIRRSRTLQKQQFTQTRSHRENFYFISGQNVQHLLLILSLLYRFNLVLIFSWKDYKENERKCESRDWSHFQTIIYSTKESFYQLITLLYILSFFASPTALFIFNMVFIGIRVVRYGVCWDVGCV